MNEGEMVEVENCYTGALHLPPVKLKCVGMGGVMLMPGMNSVGKNYLQAAMENTQVQSWLELGLLRVPEDMMKPAPEVLEMEAEPEAEPAKGD